jgi:anhydro-N-acetylmuramic acid kinase
MLGFLTWYGVPALDPGGPATGASAARVLGRISPGDRPLRLPDPVQRRPTRLRVLGREVAR